MSWHEGPIKSVCEGIFDGPHATPKESESGPVFLGIGNVTEDGRLNLTEIRHVSEQEFPKWTRRVTPKENDVVFSYEATLHRYALIPREFRGCLGRRMGLVRLHPELADPRYMLYYFLSPKWRGVIEGNIISGATVDRIPLKNFPKFPIRIHPIEQQAKIADVLAAYDNLIENNRRRIALLEQAARLLYEEWFVRFRFPGHEHAKFINGLPVGWKRPLLGDYAPLRYGKALRDDLRVDGDVPVYGSSGVVGAHNKPFVDEPGIVIGRKGNVGAVYFSEVPFWPIDTTYYIDNENVSRFLFYALQRIQFINTDVAVPGLNRDFAHSRNLTVPTDSILNEYEVTVAPFFALVKNLERQNIQLAKARDLLLPRLMSGEVEV